MREFIFRVTSSFQSYTATFQSDTITDIVLMVWGIVKWANVRIANCELRIAHNWSIDVFLV